MQRASWVLAAGIACLGLTASSTQSAPPSPLPAPAAGGDAAAKGEITAALPVIPDAKFSLADFGGVGDYKAMNTDAFKNAVAAIAKAGGGHLIVPAGIYKTLPFTLTSHMDLHLDTGATIKAPDTFEEYGIPDPNVPLPAGGGGRGRGGGGGGRVASLISCPVGTTDVAITGSGTIDGSGAMFWMWSDKAARHYPPGRRVLARPTLVSLNAQRIHVDGVTLTNSPMFHLVPRGSDITIENLRIVAPSDASNTDAMDPGGQRIIIRNCEIDSGDDCVALQSGSKDVLIEDLTCLHGHGISIGSPTRNGISHVIVRRCTFDGTEHGLRIKSYRGNGGEVHDIQYSDIVMKNVHFPIDINMRYHGNDPLILPDGRNSQVGPREADGQTDAIPNFHDIHFTNITITHSPMMGRMFGLPEQVLSNFTFTNIKVQTARGIVVSDGKEIVFENAQIQVGVGDPLVMDNATVKLNGVVKTGTSGGSVIPFY